MFTVFDAYTDKPIYSVNAPDTERSLYASASTYVMDYVAVEQEPLHLNKIKSNATSLVNSLASEKILSAYPDWKQRNMTARFVQLMMLNQLETQEAIDLKQAWDWIVDIRAASNVANAALNSAIDNEQVLEIIENYKLEIEI